MCESLVSTGNLSAGETRVGETDKTCTNDGAAHVHPMLPGASGTTTVGFNQHKICDQMTEDIFYQPHQQINSTCSQCTHGKGDSCHTLLDQSDESHSHSRLRNNSKGEHQIHSSCSHYTDSEGDSRHSLLGQNYQSHMVVLCDGETNHSNKRIGCFSWTILKSPYFACVALLCIVMLAIVGIVFRNNNSSEASLLTQIDINKFSNIPTSSTSSPNQEDIIGDTQSTNEANKYSTAKTVSSLPVIDLFNSSDASLLTQMDINKFSNIPTSSTSSPNQEDIIGDTQSTNEANNYSTAKTVSSSPVIDLFKAVDILRELLPCEPRLVKLLLKNAIVSDPKNTILDKNLHPQVVAVKRCNHGNSYCGDEYGEVNLVKKCVSINNRTVTLNVWDREEEYKFTPIGPIHLIEDLECACL